MNFNNPLGLKPILDQYHSRVLMDIVSHKNLPLEITVSNEEGKQRKNIRFVDELRRDD